MPEPAVVSVLYGPYESCGRVQHRTHRLQGLQAALTACGHQCVLTQTQDWNCVELLLRGRIVFSCDIRHLQFGGDGKLDLVCAEAVQAVDTAH